MDLLLNQLAFILKEYDFELLECSSAESALGDCYIVLRFGDLDFRIVNDRGQVFLEFRGAGAKPKDSWYSIDLLVSLITANTSESAEATEYNMKFLYQRFPEIIRVFKPTNLDSTITQLDKLGLARSKKLFG